MANAAAPAYMYGGLGFNSVGSDNSGLSRDPHTGRVVVNSDGTVADSTILVLPSIIDSISNSTWEFDWTPKGVVGTGRPILRLTYDTSGVSNTAWTFNTGTTGLSVANFSPLGASLSVASGIAVTLNRQYHVKLVRNGNARVLYINNDSISSVSSSSKSMRINRVKIGVNLAGNPFKLSSQRLYSRALTSAERLTLYNNSLRGIHDKKKFSRW
jgi:hypothetical protein